MLIKQAKIWKFFSSIKLGIWLLAIIALLSLIGTLVPQNQEQGLYIGKYGYFGYRALFNTGLTDLYSSWYFILLLILFSLNLSVCILNKFPPRSRTFGSFISHISILVILFGALIGTVFGQKGYLTLSKKEVANSFIAANKKVNLGFSVRLDDFIYTENINPEEKLLVYAVPKEAFCSTNESSGLNGSEKLVTAISMEIGKESKIADTGYKIKILRYLPDFVMDLATKKVISRSAEPNNPAIEVEFKDKAGKTQIIWVFAHFPQAHKGTDANFKFVYKWAMRRPKDFISKVTILKDGNEIIRRDIRVNEPLSFSGYTLFQSTYDSQALNWSGLKIVKDPGVAVIYLGFLMLMLGLVLIFYVQPLIRGEQKDA